MTRPFQKILTLAIFVGMSVSLAGPAYAKKTGPAKGSPSKASAVKGSVSKKSPAKAGTPKGKAVPPSPAALTSDPATVRKEMQKLRPSVLGDPDILKKVFALLFSPDFQDLVNDPEVMKAVRSFNIKALMENPKFVNAVNHPTIQEISQKVERG